MNTMQFPSFDWSRQLRLFLIVTFLLVGSLQVTRCSNDDESYTAAGDQYSRMHPED